MDRLKRDKKTSSDTEEIRGSYAIMTAILIVVFIGVTALAVDIGYLMATRNELQNVADSAALAGARVLGSIYQPMTLPQQQSYVCNPNDVFPVVIDAAIKNRAAGQNIVVNTSDILIGDWSPSAKTLTPTLNCPDAVGVTARRDSLANGAVATFFAKIFGKNTVPVSSVAIAALTAQSVAPPGSLPIPAAISVCAFYDPNYPNFCGRNIIFYPTTSSEAGWHVFIAHNANDNDLRNLLVQLEYEIRNNLPLSTPEVIIDQTSLEFTGGTMSSPTFDAMKALFDTARVLNDGVIDNDTDPNTWTTSVGVYDVANCSSTYNPTGSILIKGFATIVIEGVANAPSKTIYGRILCNVVGQGRGGGAEFGTFGDIPGLVL
ncbi:Tad domain-containing protein [bacterium]|nr:Tad domain-containing protein [bacterium]